MPNHSPSNDNAKFAIGQLIHHQLFDYRGVIADVDPVFQGSHSWYEQMARSRPTKGAPWYHVLVHDATHTTYVAEQNLAADPSADPIRDPLIKEVFDGFENGRYIALHRSN